MKNFYKLYNRNNYMLCITTAGAGKMGNSYDLKNLQRRKIFEEIGINSEDVFFVRQYHSRDTVKTDEHRFFPQTMADGLISADEAEILAVTVGDCMPVYLYDNKNDVRALLHSGWKGTGIALNALEKMRRCFGTDPSDVTAVFGPAIGSCCYNVDGQRASVFRAEWGSEAVETREGVHYLSLEGANRAMLTRAGVTDIVSSGICTCCDTRFGSFRREGAENFKQMAVISYRLT